MNQQADPLDDLRVTPGCCHDCAYRVGAPPNLDLITQLKAEACAETGTPFLCHIHTPIAGRDIACAGWIARVKQTIGQEIPAWKRQLQMAVLDMIQEAEDSQARGEVIDVVAIHNKVMVALLEKWKSDPEVAA